MVVTEGTGTLPSLPPVITEKLGFPNSPTQDQPDSFCPALEKYWHVLQSRLAPSDCVLPLPTDQCPAARLQPGALPNPV